jgi:hypothetical protein
VAIDWQADFSRRSLGEEFAHHGSMLAPNEDPPESQGSFDAVVHDFTTGPPREKVDAVINVQSFQGLVQSDFHNAAQSHYSALRPGGQTILDMLNVQGDLQNQIEEVLLSIGFYIPFHKAERWYREKLAASGIVHVMALGIPRIPYWNQYDEKDFERRREEDQKTLDSFRDEYEARQKAEAPESQAILKDGVTRVAHVVVNTG